MRIGIMLRAIDEKGGVGVYARNIVLELLQMDRDNEYVLFYRNPENIGLFARHHPHVQERLVQASNKALWDQVAIPLACRREKVDVLFHPKFTAPLLAPCPTVMTVHGADWFMPDQAIYYTWLDVRYMRIMTPLYIKKCTTVISVSQLTTDNFNQVLNLPPDKMQTVYFAPARHFRRVADEAELAAVKARYQLPDHFVLTLTKRLGDGRKNLGQIFKSYAYYHQQTDNPAKLVVGGKDCYLYKAEYGIPDDGYGADILFPDWIDQQDLPAVYSLADLYLYPSNLEAFPIPLTEAMACGTPIITSNVNGLEEIGGDAALLVDPQNTAEIAAAIGRVCHDPALRQKLSARGLARSGLFNWDDCAARTLAILQEAAGKTGHG
jgi:glycosyltransferase involved in cell wall biosynthesis